MPQNYCKNGRKAGVKICYKTYKFLAFAKWLNNSEL